MDETLHHGFKPAFLLVEDGPRHSKATVCSEALADPEAESRVWRLVGDRALAIFWAPVLALRDSGSHAMQTCSVRLVIQDVRSVRCTGSKPQTRTGNPNIPK